MKNLFGCSVLQFLMAEKPEDLNLPNAVISRLAKEAVRLFNLEVFKREIALE